MAKMADGLSTSFTTAGSHVDALDRAPKLDALVYFASNRLGLGIEELSESSRDVGEASNANDSALLLASMDPCLAFAVYSPELKIARGMHRDTGGQRYVGGVVDTFPAEVRENLRFVSAGQASMTGGISSTHELVLTREWALTNLPPLGFKPENIFLRDSLNCPEWGKLAGMSLLLVPRFDTALVFAEPKKGPQRGAEVLFETIKLG